MAFPLTPDTWTDPINQNLYAAVVFLLVQGLALGIWRFLKWSWRAKPASRLVAVVGWLGLLFPPLAILGLLVVRSSNTPALALFAALSMMPAAVAAARSHLALRRRAIEVQSQLDRFLAVGVGDAIVNPDIEAYRHFLRTASSGFAFQGVGAEKLTRDFDVFQSMVSRCGTPASPVRLLLISPEATWLKDGAARRGLGRSSFLDKQVQSLQRVARIRSEFSGHILVRFYSTRPVFRLMFANRTICWLGHYSESAAITGQNEFAEQSNSSVVLARPEGKAPDQQLYGALEMFFEDQWSGAKEEEWDFKTYLR